MCLSSPKPAQMPAAPPAPLPPPDPVAKTDPLRQAQNAGRTGVGALTIPLSSPTTGGTPAQTGLAIPT